MQQQAGSLHFLAKERDKAVPTLSGLNSHPDIWRSWYRCLDTGLGLGFWTVLFCVFQCVLQNTDWCYKTVFLVMSHSSACVLAERPRGSWMEKLFTFPLPESLSLRQFRALSPIYKADRLLPGSARCLFWSAEEAPAESAPFAVGLLYSLGNSAARVCQMFSSWECYKV